jgi:hypothetical protein
MNEGDVLGRLGVRAYGALEILACHVAPARHRTHRPPPDAGLLFIKNKGAQKFVARAGRAITIVLLAQVVVEELEQVAGFVVLLHSTPD